MRLSSLAILAGTFTAAAVGCLLTARFAVGLVEEASEYGVRQALDREMLTWAEVHSDGLQVVLTGIAPTEATRFKAGTAAGTVVDMARVHNLIKVKATADLQAPRFSLEILRNDAGISVIGLIPASMDRAALTARLRKIAKGGEVADFLETADYEVPENWHASLEFGIASLSQLPSSKISLDAKSITVTAMADSEAAKRKIETDLSRRVPKDIDLAFDISSPRPVITPFSLRFLIDDSGARFDSCSAQDGKSRDRILAAALGAGLSGKASCTIGLGVPSPKWSQAAEMAIASLAKLGGGSVTFADADITLVAVEGTKQDKFDQVVGELENDLPEVFSLHAVLPKKPDANAEGPPEFVATLSPEGLVQIRGRVRSDLTRDAAISFASSRFGAEKVHSAARIDDALPANWPVRVLAGISALGELSNGAVTVTPDTVTVSGNTGNKDAKSEIARLLSGKLGQAERYAINVTYQKKLDPVASLVGPDECIAAVNAAQKSRKIAFEPGSDNLDKASEKTLDKIAEILNKCREIRLEIGGHTDSQGREVMNQSLSQARAMAVLDGLRERKVLFPNITATGYGESKPIADNKTEEGREANRRIEFKLIRPKPVKEQKTTLEGNEAQRQKPAKPSENTGKTEGTADDQN